jgi:mRNA interferase MazF
VVTIPKGAVGRHLGYLLPPQEAALAEAILAGYDLDTPE